MHPWSRERLQLSGARLLLCSVRRPCRCCTGRGRAARHCPLILRLVPCDSLPLRCVWRNRTPDLRQISPHSPDRRSCKDRCRTEPLPQKFPAGALQPSAASVASRRTVPFAVERPAVPLAACWHLHPRVRSLVLLGHIGRAPFQATKHLLPQHCEGLRSDPCTARDTLRGYPDALCRLVRNY